MYSAGQVMTAAFLGGPLAPSWLMMANFKSIGMADKARRAMWIGIVGTLLLIVAALLLPENFPGIGLTLGVVFAYSYWYNAAQAATFQEIGEKKSWGLPIALSLLSVAIIMVLIVGLVFGIATVFPDFLE